jgi:hypothetical protein
MRPPITGNSRTLVDDRHSVTRREGHDPLVLRDKEWIWTDEERVQMPFGNRAECRIDLRSSRDGDDLKFSTEGDRRHLQVF